VTAPAIRVEGLWKEYSIGGARRSGQTLREALVEGFRAPLRGIRRAADEETRFWALSDVSFDVQPGEVVGVIGRNGAGKSTLLKVLSRITAPTKGRVEIRGRIASLLEVGAGFHAELTGRENIRLNGAILGMSSGEVARKFDQIVAFSGVEKFIDTPVKRYSSGMYMRLAFAVAAHLEPEILVIDEVLAVGDAEFQRKCLGRIGEIAGNGRTVLFVSHNMSAIRALCPSAMLLESGAVKLKGASAEAIALYVSLSREGAADIVETITPRGPHIARVGLTLSQIDHGGTLVLHCRLISPQTLRAAIEIEIHDDAGLPIVYASTAPMAGVEFDLAEGETSLTLKVGPLPLARGDYTIHLWLIKPWAEEFHRLSQPVPFSVAHSDPCGVGFDFQQSYGRGCVSVPIAFETRA